MSIVHAATGDSITFGYGLSSPYTERWPSQVGYALGLGDIANTAVTGAKITQAADRAAIDPGYPPGGSGILWVCIGSNDISASAGAAATLAALDAWLTLMVARGWSHRILPVPMRALAAPELAELATYNAALVSTYGAPDASADTRVFGAAYTADTTYFQADQIHPTFAGASVIAEYALTLSAGFATTKPLAYVQPSGSVSIAHGFIGKDDAVLAHTRTAARYLHVFESSTEPDEGTTPIKSVALTANAQTMCDMPPASEKATALWFGLSAHASAYVRAEDQYEVTVPYAIARAAA